MLALGWPKPLMAPYFDERRRPMAAPLHNRNRSLEGLKNPHAAAFFEVASRASCDVVNDQDYRAARLVETDFAAGFAAAAGCGAVSHPPAGVAALTASSGWGSAVNVWIASLAAASDWASRRFAISSRLRPASASPCAAARLNHLKDSARFCSTPMPRA